METTMNKFQKLEDAMFHYGFQHLFSAAQEFAEKQRKILTTEAGAECFEHMVSLKQEYAKNILKAVGEGLSSHLFWKMFMEYTFEELCENVGTQDMTGEDLHDKFRHIIMPLVNTLFHSHNRLRGYGDADEAGMAICMMEELRLLDELQVYLDLRRKSILGDFTNHRKAIRSSYKNMFDAYMEAPVQVTV